MLACLRAGERGIRKERAVVVRRRTGSLQRDGRVYFLAGFFAAGFLAAGFFAAGFLAAGFLAAGFLAAGFFAAGFFAAGFFAAGFFAAGFFAAGFFAVGFLAAGFLAAGFLAATILMMCVWWCFEPMKRRDRVDGFRAILERSTDASREKREPYAVFTPPLRHGGECARGPVTG